MAENEVETLSERHKRFVVLYAQYLNARKAYQEVYPDVSEDSARVLGSLLLTNLDIKAAVAEECKKHLMPKEEILTRINSIASLNMQEYTDDKGELDLAKMKKAGIGYMIKSISDTKYGKRVQIHDQYKALETLAKIAKLYDDSDSVTVNVNNEIKAEDILNDRLSKARNNLTKPVDVGENSALTQTQTD